MEVLDGTAVFVEVLSAKSVPRIRVALVCGVGGFCEAVFWGVAAVAPGLFAVVGAGRLLPAFWVPEVPVFAEAFLLGGDFEAAFLAGGF